MTLKVAINGFGRIGRNVLRAIIESGRTDIEVIAINDLGSVKNNAHLLKYDSVHGRFPAVVTVGEDFIDVSKGPIRVTAMRNPADLPWADVDVVILVMAKNHFERWAIIKKQWLSKHVIQIVEGGETRFHSVRNGLKWVDGPGIVAIHDAARPCVSAQLINAGYEAAAIHKSAVASVALKDSIREKSGGTTVSRDRSNYYLIQTPQTFDIDLLKKSYEMANGARFTDDASVVDFDGHEIHLIEGSYPVSYTHLTLPTTPYV